MFAVRVSFSFFFVSFAAMSQRAHTHIRTPAGSYLRAFIPFGITFFWTPHGISLNIWKTYLSIHSFYANDFHVLLRTVVIALRVYFSFVVPTLDHFYFEIIMIHEYMRRQHLLKWHNTHKEFIWFRRLHATHHKRMDTYLYTYIPLEHSDLWVYLVSMKILRTFPCTCHVSGVGLRGVCSEPNAQ